MGERSVIRPRIVIAGTSSGCGKTLISCALIRLLQKEGSGVRAFKCGPDYIDPMFHRRVLQTPSGNLDSFFCSEEELQTLVADGGTEDVFTVIEGVMGYFDGIGGTSFAASTYDVAGKTKSPVLLVVDAAGTSRSVIATLKGFVDYEQAAGASQIAGVIFNRMTPALLPEMQRLAKEECGISYCACLPKLDVTWESRHLGLMLPEEIAFFEEQVGKVTKALKETLDVRALADVMKGAPALQGRTFRETFLKGNRNALNGVRIGIAKDAAFCFLYEENVRLLREMGAEITFFSPLEDETLPEADGFLFPGGYPELHLKELSENTAMRSSVREVVKSGKKILAECGGLLYLQQSIRDEEGHTHAMCGVLSGESFPTKRLVRFGYVTVTTDTGKQIRGHEFHYYDSTENGTSFTANKASTGTTYPCVKREHNIIAGFPHLYYPSCPGFAAEVFAPRNDCKT